jgi:hypothetical protein
MSGVPEVMIVTADGRPVARISYNGIVWPGGGMVSRHGAALQQLSAAGMGRRSGVRWPL